MIGNTHTDYNYRGRVYRHKAVEKQIQEDIKIMVHSLMRSDRRRLVIEKASDVVYADGSKIDYYDGYSSCKSGLKKYCPASRKKWAGYIEEYDEEDKEWYRPYILLSESEFGVYLEVLNFYFGRQAQFPAVL